MRRNKNRVFAVATDPLRVVQGAMPWYYKTTQKRY